MCFNYLKRIPWRAYLNESKPKMTNDPTKAAWKEFIENHVVSENIPKIIANSWMRSWSHINLANKLKVSYLSSEYFLATQIANFDFVSFVRPIMEDAYQYAENSNTVIYLTNGAGYVLTLLGDVEMLERLNNLGIEQGALLSEEQIGTNAAGLALKEHTPVRVMGAEHYRPEFHGFSAVAAPIFDLTGRSIGALCLVTMMENYHPHSFGLVAAGARAIEGQIQSEYLLEEQNSQLAQLNTILSSITDGIMVWNEERTLLHVNDAASRILELTGQLLVGKRVDRVLNFSSSFIQSMEQRESLRDVEVSILTEEKTINCILSLYFVHKKNDMYWGIVTLRPETEVRSLVQKQVGARAVLTLDDIPGESVQVQRIRSFVRSAANAEASILIRGEPGTGKNALANAIHNASRRSDGPFIIFSCTSIPNELVLDELLGYDENSGMVRGGSRPSKFELAKAGTIFFQDVDALPLEAQSILLNELEMGFIQRIGSQRPIEVDVRVIACTSARMEALIAQGTFRADLYYRLSTFAITIPPLRERNRDIPLVVERILRRLSAQLGHRFSLGHGVIDILRRYSWPGNVREIESVLGRAATQVGTSGIIELSHLPNILRSGNQYAGNVQSQTMPTLSEVERATIIQAAEYCHGNVTQMANVLGISRATLWRHIKTYDLDVDNYRDPVSYKKVFHRQ